jgi:hypothetical protein
MEMRQILNYVLDRFQICGLAQVDQAASERPIPCLPSELRQRLGRSRDVIALRIAKDVSYITN